MAETKGTKPKEPKETDFEDRIVICLTPNLKRPAKVFLHGRAHGASTRVIDIAMKFILSALRSARLSVGRANKLNAVKAKKVKEDAVKAKPSKTTLK